MDLFSEYKNSSLLKVVEAVNESLRGKKIARQTLLNDLTIFAKTASGRPEFDLAQETDLVDTLFTEQEFKPVEGAMVPIVPSTVELEWLREMLADPHAQSLLDPGLIQKLQERLSSLKDEPCVWQRRYLRPGMAADFEDEAFRARLRLIQQALRRQVMVYYESYDEYGNNYKGEAVPFKLEYSFLKDSYNFIMWNPQKQWTFKSDVATITKLNLVEKAVDKAVKDQAEAYVKKLRQETPPLVLTVRDKYNALERCFNLFASYDKEVKQIAKGEYEIKLYYYSHFDEEELVWCVHSLGSAVTVQAPQSIRERIIANLKT